MNKKLPPPAVTPDEAKKAGQVAGPHERVLERIPEKTRPRYRDTVKLIEKLCWDHAESAIRASEQGDSPPEADAELVSAIAQYATTGRLE